MGDSCCAICLSDDFTNPRVLECGHTYCKECIVTYQRRGENNVCPQCRVPLPQTARELCEEINLLYARRDARRGADDEQRAAVETQILALAREACEVDAKYVPAQMELGHALDNAGDVDGAIDAFRAAIAAGRAYGVDARTKKFHWLLNYARAHTRLGALLSMSGDTEGAQEHLYKSLGLLLERSGLEGAEQQLHDAAVADCHVNLGVAYKAVGDNAAAESAFREALRCNDESYEAAINLGNLERARGRMESAASHLKAACELAPHEAVAHYSYARCLLLSRQFSDAEHRFRECLRCDPSHADAHLCLGVLYLERGGTTVENVRKSRAAWERVLELEESECSPRAKQARRNLDTLLAIDR